MKICRECGITDDMVEFYVRWRKRKCGYRISRENICLPCKRAKYPIWYEANRRSCILRAAAWKKKNRKKVNKIERRAYARRRTVGMRDFLINTHKHLPKGADALIITKRGKPVYAVIEYENYVLTRPIMITCTPPEGYALTSMVVSRETRLGDPPASSGITLSGGMETPIKTPVVEKVLSEKPPAFKIDRHGCGCAKGEDKLCKIHGRA